MLRVLVGSWMVRYPLGGNLSWTLQWLLGFRRLGHDVYLIEKSGYPDSCFDPVRGAMGDDCSHGAAAVDALLTLHGLEGRWCYVDAVGGYHGMPRGQAHELIDSADLFVDLGTHGTWLDDLPATCRRVLVDGEPGSTQIKMEGKLAAGESLPTYDFYYTNGASLGTPLSNAPTVGLPWRSVFNPVVVDLFDSQLPPANAPFTTVMNWQSHRPIRFRGREYGQKDVEFRRFLDLPRRTRVPLEVAVAGKYPREELLDAGWAVRNAHEVTASFDGYRDYIRRSRGEFGVCKNVFIETRSGWFSDRSAAYLAGGRPVVLQDTGFSAHLPCGRGLFAVRTADEAAAAIDEIARDFDRQSRWARDLAAGYLDAARVIGRLLREIGLSPS
jgi:hypothetical protein